MTDDSYKHPEEWKDVVGYEGFYKVSSVGRVKSLCYGKQRIMKTSSRKTGHKLVSLAKLGKNTTYSVHRLIAQAFIPNPDNKLFIDHIDNNPSNNCISNLRWVTRSENAMNTIKYTHNTSGYKGVSYEKSSNKYKASIKHKQIQYNLGRFATAEEAHDAYCAKAIELFGEYFNPG